MFKMTFAGQLELLGSGRTTSAFMTRRSLVKIGQQRIRNVMVSDYLDSMLESGIDDGQDTALSVGWVMFFRWVLAVRHRGETFREGIVLFAAGLLTHWVVVGLAALLGGLITGGFAPIVVGAILIYGLASTVMNVKAWIAPTF